MIPTISGKEQSFPGVRLPPTFWPFLASQVALVVKNLPANAGNIKDSGSILRSGRSSEEGQGTPLPVDRGAWWATVHGVA